jgi:hypothetical protein
MIVLGAYFHFHLSVAFLIPLFATTLRLLDTPSSVQDLKVSLKVPHYLYIFVSQTEMYIISILASLLQVPESRIQQFSTKPLLVLLS